MSRIFGCDAFLPADVAAPRRTNFKLTCQKFKSFSGTKITSPPLT